LPAASGGRAREDDGLKIRVGYELVYECPQPTPMVLMLNVHYSRVSDLIAPDHLITDPALPIAAYRDSFGNWCSRIVAPAGMTRITSDAIVRDSGVPDPVVATARQTPIAELPGEALIFLLGSRYCETELLMPIAWNLFGHTPWAGHACRRSATSCMVI
jgi:transglutaminase-like putative cysteine protease